MPGGRPASSDIVTRGEMLSAPGFTDATIEPTRVYRVADAREVLDNAIDADQLTAAVNEKFFSGFVRTVKP